MLSDFKEILSKLNSKSDNAIVIGAAVIGFTADMAINIIPIPAFSPGVCGLTAAGAALSAKRSWEAWIDSGRVAKLLDLYSADAERVASDLENRGHIETARALTVEVKAAGIQRDHAALKSALDEARKLL